MADVSQLLETRRSRLGRWAGAALVVCALHVGGAALALMHWPEEVADGAAGAMIVDLAAVPAPMPVDSENVAPGPQQQEEARQRQEAAKEVVKEVQEDIPPAEPSPAPEPDVALPKPQPDDEEQPKEKAQEAAAEEDVPQPDDFNQEEAAPPPVDAEPAPSSAAAQGRSADAARVQATWQNALSRHLERFKRYPRAARRRGVEGGLTVRIVLDRSGQVVTAEIVKSSGSSILEKEALETLKRASPLPVPPAGVPDDLLEILLPFDFQIEE